MATGTTTSERSEQTPRSGVLVQHEESSQTGAVKGCQRWPEGMWLLMVQTGQLFRGRCKSTNLCDYCAKLVAVENTELLTLDALHGQAPNLYGLLTTRTATVDMRHFYRATERVLRDLRSHWPVERASLIEYTTGRGIRAGGQRRPHFNDLYKGIPDADRLDARSVIRDRWCREVDALPEHQDLQPIHSAGGLMRYIALHFQKQSQKPPEGFKGHRFRCTSGYLWMPRKAAREAARASLHRKRHTYRVEKQTNGDLDMATVDHIVDQLVALDQAKDWKLVQTLPQSSARPQLAKKYAGTKPDGHLIFDRTPGAPADRLAPKPRKEGRTA